MYRVILRANGNPDHMENPFESICPTQEIFSSSIDGCRKIVREFIESSDIGSGNWTGGQVYDHSGAFVGYISYNGRFWEKGHPYAIA